MKIKKGILVFVIVLFIINSHSVFSEDYGWYSTAEDIGGDIYVELDKLPEGEENKIELSKGQVFEFSDGQIYTANEAGTIALRKDGDMTIIDTNSQITLNTNKGSIDIGPSIIEVTDDGYKIDFKDGGQVVVTSEDENCLFVGGIEGRSSTVELKQKSLGGEWAEGTVSYGNVQKYSLDFGKKCGSNTEPIVSDKESTIDGKTDTKEIESNLGSDTSNNPYDSLFSSRRITKEPDLVLDSLEKTEYDGTMLTLEEVNYYFKNNVGPDDPATLKEAIRDLINSTKKLINRFKKGEDYDIYGGNNIVINEKGDIQSDGITSYADRNILLNETKDLEIIHQKKKDAKGEIINPSTEIIYIKADKSKKLVIRNPTDKEGPPYVLYNVEDVNVQINEEYKSFILNAKGFDGYLVFPNAEITFNGELNVEVNNDIVSIKGDNILASTGEETVIGDASLIIIKGDEMRHVGIGKNARYELGEVGKREGIAIYNPIGEWHQIYLLKEIGQEKSETCDYCSYLNFIDNTYFAKGALRVERRSVLSKGWDTIIDSYCNDNTFSLEMDSNFNNAKMQYSIDGVTDFKEGNPYTSKCLNLDTHIFNIQQYGLDQYVNNNDIRKNDFVKTYKTPYSSDIIIYEDRLENDILILNAPYNEENQDKKENMWTRLQSKFYELTKQIN